MKTVAKKITQKRVSSGLPSNDTVEYGIEKSTLMKLFEDQLKDIYWAEKALEKAIPKMIRKATSQELVNALTTHLQETNDQVKQLEKVFELLEKKAQAKKCDAMDGLIKEAEGIMDESDEGAMRDAGIIAAVQKIEHYEIASYGTLRTFAQTLELEDAADIMDNILEEEKNADEILTGIAESINIKAASVEKA